MHVLCSVLCILLYLTCEIALLLGLLLGFSILTCEASLSSCERKIVKITNFFKTNYCDQKKVI